MKKPGRFIAIALLLLLGAASWWLTRPPDVRLTFLRYQENYGARSAVLILENFSSEEIRCHGVGRSLFTKFESVSPSGAEVKSHGGGGCVIETFTLQPGECREFQTDLESYADPDSLMLQKIEAPFRVGVDFVIPKRMGVWRYFDRLGIPARWRPPTRETAWTEMIEK